LGLKNIIDVCLSLPKSLLWSSTSLIKCAKKSLAASQAQLLFCATPFFPPIMVSVLFKAVPDTQCLVEDGIGEGSCFYKSPESAVQATMLFLAFTT
jgi:hypothetical protein